MANHRVTIQAVAADANVSLATVSRVINQSGPVREDTRQRVLESAARLGYQIGAPSRSAPADSRLILFNFPIISNPFYNEIIQGAKLSAEQHGFHLLFHEGHVTAASLPELLSIVKKVKAAGLIVTNQIPAPLLMELERTLPVVQCGEFSEDSGLPFVSVDDVQAAITAVEHLAAVGKRRIAILNGPERYKYAKDRLEGYQLALERAGLPFDPRLVVGLPDVSYALALSAARQLISTPQPPDAIFCCSDVFAAAAVRAVTLRGLRIPEDIAIVGFDNADISSITVPSITTINQPKIQMGFSACEMLITRLLDPQAPIRSVWLDTELIVRESTAGRDFSQPE